MQAGVMTPGGKYILAEGQQCSEKSRSLTELMGTEIAYGLVKGWRVEGGSMNRVSTGGRNMQGLAGLRVGPWPGKEVLFNAARFK